MPQVQPLFLEGSKRKKGLWEQGVVSATAPKVWAVILSGATAVRQLPPREHACLLVTPQHRASPSAPQTRVPHQKGLERALPCPVGGRPSAG